MTPSRRIVAATLALVLLVTTVAAIWGQAGVRITLDREEYGPHDTVVVTAEGIEARTDFHHQDPYASRTELASCWTDCTFNYTPHIFALGTSHIIAVQDGAEVASAGYLRTLAPQQAPMPLPQALRTAIAVEDRSHRRIAAQVRFIRDDGLAIDAGNGGSVELVVGDYTAEIIPAVAEMLPIRRILLRGIAAGNEFRPRLERIEPGDGFVDGYAIDPSTVEFSGGEIVATATGNALWKCADWDFDAGTCGGGWVKVRRIVPGEDYTIPLARDDPAFAETIEVIMVQSYPTLYGDWTVEFLTEGTADLVITPMDGTTWGEDGAHDLRFIEVRCGDEAVDREWADGSVIVRDYTCEGTGTEVSTVLTAEKHGLHFQYGMDEAYAYNDVNDFKVQRGYATIPGSSATATITAGVDYAAPTGPAFIRIVGTRLTGMGATSGGTSNQRDDADSWSTSITNPSNLATSITFSRHSTDNWDDRIAYEIIEYTGPAGGKNEMKVRQAGTVTYVTTGTTVDTSAVSGISDDADVVVFITGQRSPETGTNTGSLWSTAEWLAASDTARFTRGDAGGDATSVSYAVVEFTGSNWKVQRVQHQFTAAGSWQYRSITPVASTAKTFIHTQHRAVAASPGLDEAGEEAYLYNTTHLALQLESSATTPANHYAVAWIVENSQSQGTTMKVQHLGGTRATGGSEEDTWAASITPVSSKNTTSISCENGRSAGTGTSYPRGSVTFLLNSTSTVELKQADTAQAQAYRFCAVEWPTMHEEIAPKVTKANVTPSPQTVGLPVTISTNVTDGTGVNATKGLVSLSNGTKINCTMTDPDKDSIYTCVFSTTGEIGTHNVTIWANDTYGTVNQSVKTSFVITYGTLAVWSGKTSYIEGETVDIYGTGFTPGEEVTLIIFDPGSDPVNVTPTNRTANATGGISFSWVVPAGQQLGTYTLNATDTSNPSRKAAGTFDIVSAVVQADAEAYSQGDTVIITGYSWDAGENVTLNITAPGGTTVYGPVNRTANATGWISDSWQVTYGSQVGNHMIHAFQADTPSKSDTSVFEVTTLESAITPQHTWYRWGEMVNITGTGFSAGGEVTVDISNTTGSIPGYPANSTANSTGAFTRSWTVPADQQLGTYTLDAADVQYDNLNDTSLFDIAVQGVSTDLEVYQSGDTVVIVGHAWWRGEDVTVDVRNSTGGSKPGFPKNLTADSNGTIVDTWTAQPGGTVETHNLSAFQAGRPSLSDWTLFNVTLVATLSADQEEYYQDALVTLSGSFFSDNGDVTVDIVQLASGGNAKGYPATIQADGSGDIAFTWNTSRWCEGAYLVTAVDEAFPDQLFANTTFSINYSMLPFANFGFEENSFEGWAWGKNSFLNNGEDCNDAEFGSGGDRIVSATVGDWAKDGGIYTGGGGEQADTLDGTDSGATGYTGMLTSEMFTIPQKAKNLTFWIHSDYRSADNSQCYGAADGYRFSGTANQTANDWGEGCIHAVWVEAGVPGRTGDYYIWEKHSTRYVASAGCTSGANPFCPEETVTLDVTPYLGLDIYLTAECIGRGNVDDALVQIDGTGWGFPAAQSCTPFDTTPPTVKQIAATPKPQSLGLPVAITANITDASNVSVAYATVSFPNGTKVNISLTDPDKNNIFSGTLTDTLIVGTYNISVWANDTWNNINATQKGNLTVQYGTLAVWTAKTSYIRTETAQIYGTGYNALVDVTLDLANSSGSVPGYPKNVSTNQTGGFDDSWVVPASQQLGTYTLNATDTTDASRNATGTFDIVTAVVQADAGEFEQGWTVGITGYNWDAGENVTINITGPSSIVVYGPANRTANATGWISDNWQVPYDAQLGSYTLGAYEPAAPEKTDTFPFTVSRRTIIITADYPWYKEGDQANVTGSGFRAGQGVTVDISNSTGPVPGYPTAATANATGHINGSWTVPGGQQLGGYVYNATDTLYPDMTNSTSFSIVMQQVATDSSGYSSGDLVQITGSYWDRHENVTLDLVNSTGGRPSGFPKNVTANEFGEISSIWVAEPGSGTTIEPYILIVRDATDPGENDSVSFNVTRKSTLAADRDHALPQSDVSFAGSYYSANGDVGFSIVSLANGGTALGYPKLLPADGAGSISDSWNVSDYCPGEYRASAADMTYPELLFANVTFEIAYHDPRGRNCSYVWGTDCGAGPPEAADTTFDACPYGTGGVESVIDAFVNTTIVNPGDGVSLTCAFDPFSTASEYLIWYYNGTGWKMVESGSAPGSAPFNKTVTVTMDNRSGQHWLRCIIDRDGEGDSCANVGTTYDNDDVNVTVYNPPGSCTLFDIVPPSVTQMAASPTAQNISGVVNITANVTDSATVSTVIAIITFPNSSAVNLSMADTDADDIYNLTFTQTAVIGAYTVGIWANDSWGNVNGTGSTGFSVNDATAPTWSGISARPASGVTYAPGASYQFNASWMDMYLLGTVWVEHNFTGALDTYAVSGNASDEYYYDYNDLAAGSYIWRMHANDSSGNVNSTPPTAYLVMRRTPLINLTLDGGNDNLSVEVPAAVNITGEIIEGEGGATIYQNGTAIGADQQRFETVSNYLSPMDYNITLVHNASENFSRTERTLILAVEDTTPPTLDGLLPPNGTGHAVATTVTVSVNATDNHAVANVTANVSRFSGWDLLTLLDTDLDEHFSANLSDTAIPGRYNMTVVAYDPSGNSASAEGWFLIFDIPGLVTDAESYVRNDTVVFTGVGFSIVAEVTVDIRNGSGSVPGYPTNVTSNASGSISGSWDIPSDQQLGTYTIDAIDTSDPSRNASDSFDIVTAIIMTAEETYIQGDNATILGHTWDPLTDVTINITDPYGALVAGPWNVTSDGSGNLTGNWQAPFDAPVGAYTLSAYEPLSPNKADIHGFAVGKRNATVTLDYSWYREDDIAQLAGALFSPGTDITIDVIESTGSSIPGYPANSTANGSGGIAAPIALSGLAAGGYTINATDTAYPNLNGTAAFSVVVRSVATDKASYGNGETVAITGAGWDRGGEVMVEVRNQTGSLISGYPKNRTADGNGSLSDSLVADAGELSSNEHQVIAYQASNASQNATADFTALKQATISIPLPVYDQNDMIPVYGDFYTHDGTVFVMVKNSTSGLYAPFYPRSVTANGTGGVATSYYTSDICEGTYRMVLTDGENPSELSANTTFQIAFREDNSSEESADSRAIMGSFDASGGTLSNSSLSDDRWEWFAGIDAGTDAAAVNYTFAVGSLGASPDLIRSLGITAEFCYSGNQGQLRCGTGANPHEGTANGPQELQAYNHTGGSWITIGTLVVNDTADTEYVLSNNYSAGIADLVKDDAITLRFTYNFTRIGFSDDLLLIDYLGVNVSYEYPVGRSCTPFTNLFLNLTVLNASGAPAQDSTVEVLMANGTALDSGDGPYGRYVGSGTYDIRITADSPSGTTGAILDDLVVGSDLTLAPQLVDEYIGWLPAAINQTTLVFALDDSALTYASADLAIPTKGATVDAVLHCLSWDYAKDNCTAWDLNETGDYDASTNGTHLLLTTTAFDAFGGGGGSTLVNLTNISVWDITGLPVFDRSNLTEGGLDRTFQMDAQHSYRIEFDVRNLGISWAIDAADVAYQSGLNGSWGIDDANNVWYTDGGGTNYTGGTWSGGKVDWDLSLGGRIRNSEEGRFSFVVNITTNRTELYPVHFLLNDTSKASGSYDYSAYNITGLLADLLINRTLVSFNRSDPAEGETIVVSANVTNLGGRDANGVTVEIWDNTTATQLGSGTINVSQYGWTVFNATWDAVIGRTNLSVVVDPPLDTNGSVEEENESNNLALRDINVSAWQVYYGLVSGNISLADSQNRTEYRWDATSLIGNVYVADEDSMIDWSALQALGRDTANLSRFIDFAQLDATLNMTGYNDSVNSTFTAGGSPLRTVGMELFGVGIGGVPVVNSTNTTSFLSGIVWDTDDGGNGQYDGTEDVVFVTVINESKAGRYGTYDYEIKVPVRLRDYVPGSSTVAFYGEIR
ncbi:hypothetical protein JXB02_00045 [Candidatus Woesearchaeota archaeon]|nr:hypothetical protein [Candidatus Woesearchaeota archaeon]